MKKHKVEVDVLELGKLDPQPPRRKLWDLLPEWLGMWLLKRGFNPQPTPYEIWMMKQIMLRAYYTSFVKLVAAPVETAYTTAPGSTELN